jgi:gamma-glutamyltranspeptidase/glutathione hydrolase
MTADDLAQHTGTWVEPISTNYRGYDVWEIPPNGQGLAALIALNLLEHDAFGLAQGPRESVDSYHVQIEAMKLAFADAHRYIADPEYAAVPTQELLAKDYAASRRALIGDRAEVRQAGDPVRGGTIYLCAADQDGMMVSYIQSNYAGFGSGVVVPGTGIALQNRGSGFSLDPNHPNVLEPGKRPFHTIIPAFLTRDGEAVGPFGVMGGHMQPQGHLQVVLNTIEWGMNPQAALDAPRWMVMSGLDVLVEPSVGPEIVQGLQARGHQLHLGDPEPFGRGQIIWRLPSGALVAGTEPRADGAALGY